MFYTRLEDRGLLGLAGPDAREFLQGLISNDVETITAGHAIYGALLTPQGKFLFDFFIFQGATETELVLDCEDARLSDLKRHLTKYQLRAKLDIEEISPNSAVFVCFGGDVSSMLSLDTKAGSSGLFGSGTALIDPRLAEMGGRVVTPVDSGVAALTAAGFVATDRNAWDAHRLTLGVPDGSRDILVEKSFPLECNFDELNAISYTKGCYIGQELTARTHHRGTVRKRLLPVTFEGPTPESGAPVMSGDRQVGEMRWGSQNRALATLRLEHIRGVQNPVFTVGETTIRPFVPHWVVLPDLPDIEN